VEGKTGSADGLPSVLLKKVMVVQKTSDNDDGSDVMMIESLPVSSGLVDDIFIPAREIEEDPRINNIRVLNPAQF
jgi:hypothetical protein